MVITLPRDKQKQIHIQSGKDFIKFLHGDNTASIQFVQLEEGSIKRHFSIDTMNAINHVKDWLEKDCYVSLNTFKAKNRRSDNVLRLNALYTDLDCYKIGIDTNEARSQIEDMIANEEIPIPSAIVYSGRGLQLIWLLEHMVGSSSYIKLWERMQESIYDRFQSLNADRSAKLISQIYRIPGSINSKNNTVVKIEYLKQKRYSITEMKDFLLEELPSNWKEETEKKRVKRLEKIKKRQENQKTNTDIKTKTPLTLAKARLIDLERLVHIRDGNVNRRRFIFCYTIISAKAAIDQSIIKHKLEKINQQFYKRLSSGVLNSAINSIPNKYKFTNDFIINNLEITMEEQKIMTAIIGSNEKNRRKRQANEIIRRESGISTAKEYKEQRQQLANERMEALSRLLESNPKFKNENAAELLSVSVRTIQVYKQKLKNL